VGFLNHPAFQAPLLKKEGNPAFRVLDSYQYYVFSYWLLVIGYWFYSVAKVCSYAKRQTTCAFNDEQ